MTVNTTETLEFVRAEDVAEPHAFRAGVQEYLVRRNDGSFESLRWRWDEALATEMAALREPGHDPALPRRLGDRLRSWIGAAIGLERLADAAARGEPFELRISSSAAELYALPWELMTLPGSGAHLGAIASIQVNYRWPAATCAEPAASPRPEGGRIVLAWSRAFGPAAERQVGDALAAAAHEGHVAWDMSSDTLADVSLPGLVAALERDVAAGRAPAVLHLLCHGAPVGGGYGLGLDDGRGGAVVVDAGTLARALAPLARHVRLVVLMACDSGNPGVPGTHLGSAAQELHRAGFEAVVASRLPLSGAGAVEFTAALYRSLLVETCSIDHAFAAARARLVRLPGALDWASVQLYRHAAPGSDRRPIVFRPYRGLLAFDGPHARFFFGRDAEAAEVLGDLEALLAAGSPRLLVVTGASGTGKSSLVLAAVRPQLERRGWTCAVIRPGASPQQALAEALARTAREPPLALIVDQFEEVFTHAGDGARRAFARALWDLARRTDRRIAVITTLRVDFLGRCGELVLGDGGPRLDEVAYDEAHRVFVAHMPAGKLAEAIVRPAERVGLRLEDGLCARLLRDVGEEPGALPLLQYTLDALWSRRIGDVLTHAALDAIGGAFGALERHADATVAGLDPAAQAQARRLLVRLAAYSGDMSSGTRRRVPEAELRPPRATEATTAAFDRAVRALIDARLIGRDDAGSALEISHEALIRGWRALFGWYEAERERLAMQLELARLVDDSRRYGRALAGRALTRAQELGQGLGDELSPEAQALIAAGAHEAAVQRRNRLLGLFGLFVVLAAAALVSATFWARSAAQAKELATSLSRARDMTRIAAAEQLLFAQPWAAAALLAEVSHTDLPGWRQAAFTVSQTALPSRFIPLANPERARFAPDGAWVVAPDDAGAVRAWSLRDEPLVHVFGGSASHGAVVDLALTGDGEGLTIAVRRERGVELWRLRDGVGTALAAAPLVATAPLRYAGGRLALETAAGVDVLQLQGARLEPVASALPCKLLAADRLLCRLSDAPELRTFAEPTRGEPVPATRVEFCHDDGSFDAIAANGDGIHMAWNGERLISTGFRRRQEPIFEPDGILGRRFVAADRATVYSAINTEGQDGPTVADKICRDDRGPPCVEVEGSRLAEGLAAGVVVASNAESWQILNRGRISTRQIVRRPTVCAPLRPRAEDRALACWSRPGSLWVWSLDDGAQAVEAASPFGVIGFQPERARWLERRGGDAVKLAVVDPRGEQVLVVEGTQLSTSDICSMIAFDGDVAAGACAYNGKVEWLDFAGGLRWTNHEEPGEGSSVVAVHAATRRAIQAIGGQVSLFDFSGPTPRTVKKLDLAPEKCSNGTAVAIAPDGRTAAVGCREGRLLLLGLDPLDLSTTVSPGRGVTGDFVSALEFSPAGDAFVAGGAYGTLARFRRGAGDEWTEEILSSPDQMSATHKETILGIWWTPEGLTTLDRRGAIAVWDGAPLVVPDIGRSGNLVSVGRNAGGTLLGGTWDGLLKTWHAVTDLDGLQKLLRTRARYCATPTERETWLGETPEEAVAASQRCSVAWREIVVDANGP